MGFGLPFNVGYFSHDPVEWVVRRLDVDLVRRAIAESGGTLADADVTAETLARRRNRLLLGHVDRVPVILHEHGFLAICLVGVLAPQMHRFLSRLCREHGCDLVHPDTLEFITDSLLRQLEPRAKEEQT